MGDQNVKKQLIKIECPHEFSTNYRHTSLNYAFVSSPENGRKQCSRLITCRESVNNRACINSSSDNAENMDFEKLRLLLVQDAEDGKDADLKQRLFSGKALLNRYEEKAGWPSTSKITTVNHKYHKSAWLLTGPKEWMSQPQLLSIATIFMRIMSVHGPIEVDTFQQAEDGLRKLYTDYMKAKNKYLSSNNGNGNVFSYYPDIENYLQYIDDFKTILTNVDEIFGKVSLKEAWSKSAADKQFCIQSGILSFLGSAKLDYNKSVSDSRLTLHKIKNKAANAGKE